MQDRFKFRFWHKPYQEMQPCYGFNEEFVFADTLDGIFTKYAPAKFSDCVLMQCTGLKDKNGKLIYEGDIIKELHSSVYSAVVYYNVQRAAFKLQGKGYYTGALETIRNDYFEVIGNIYENPELLEDKNGN